MKKVISALLAALMLVSLAACGGGSSAKSADLSAFLDSLYEKYNDEDAPFTAYMDMTEFPDMMDPAYVSLTELPTKQLKLYQPMMGAVVCEIALVELENSGDVQKAKDLLQARVDSQVNGGAWYPETIEGWKNYSRIVSNGNCVMLIAWEKCDDVVNDFNALFK